MIINNATINNFIQKFFHPHLWLLPQDKTLKVELHSQSATTGFSFWFTLSDCLLTGTRERHRCALLTIVLACQSHSSSWFYSPSTLHIQGRQWSVIAGLVQSLWWIVSSRLSFILLLRCLSLILNSVLPFNILHATTKSVIFFTYVLYLHTFVYESTYLNAGVYMCV